MLVAFDVIVRHLRASGFEVRFVRNVTDIDDKIIRRAATPTAMTGRRGRRAITPTSWPSDQDAARHRAARRRAAGHRARPRDHRAHRALDATRARLRRRRRRLLRGPGASRRMAQLSGRASTISRRARASRSASRSAARSTSRCGRRAKPGEPRGRRPWGPGRPGLAHRVLGDGRTRSSARRSTSTAAATT